MNDLFYIVLIFISISSAIFAKHFGKYKLYIFLKPLTMLLIIAFPLVNIQDEYSLYDYLVVTALVVSLVGDLFLLFPDKYFTSGLISFLIAHLIYIVAFNIGIINYIYLLVIPILAYVFLVLRKLNSNLGKYKYHVIIYVLVIAGMLFSALNREIILYHSVSYLSMAAVLFIISDTTLAFNKFYKKNNYAEIVILLTYFIAQLLFALTI